MISLVLLILYVWANLFRNYYIYSLKKKTFEDISVKIDSEELKQKKIKEKKEMYENEDNIKNQILKKNKLKRPGEDVIEFIE